MEIHLQEERAAGRCAFCHGDLGPYRLTCTTCHSAYHSDCTDRCVSLGCGGELRLARPSVPESGDERTGLIVTAVFFAILFGLGLTGGPRFVGVFFLASVAIGVLYGSFRVCQEAWRYATAPARPRTPRSLAAPPSPPVEAAPHPPAAVEGLPLPDMFAAHPIEVAPPAPSTDERRHQSEALRDRHPPGLGRTL